MLEKLVLLIDFRKETSTKYCKYLNTSNIKVVTKASIKDAIQDITLQQPDLILVSDSVCKNLSEDIRNLRLLTYNFRPVIIALSKSSHLQDKLDVLEAGADDYFEEPIIKEEFNARIQAHIRKVLELQTNIHTNLYNAQISYKTLTRALVSNKEFSVLLININYFNEYKNIYGELAAEKMLQAYSAVIKSTLTEDDYLGQIGNDDFIIITIANKAEKLADFLTHAFDLLAQKFYSEQDFEHGYIIMNGDDVEETPIPIVSTNIAIISNEYKKYSNPREIMTDLLLLHKTLRTKSGSNYLKDRLKISGVNNIAEKIYNKRVLIIEEDEALNLLLESNFIMRNYDVKTILSLDNIAIDDILEFNPALIVLDAGKDKNLEGFNFLNKTLVKNKDIVAKIILTTIVHNKQELLNSGVDLYIPKPYRIQNFMIWAEKLLKQFND